MSNKDSQSRAWPNVYASWAPVSPPTPIMYHRGWKQGHLEP